MKLNRTDLHIMTIKAPSPSIKKMKNKSILIQPVPLIQSPLVNTAININILDAKVPLCLAGNERFLLSFAQSTTHKVWADSPSVLEDTRRKRTAVKSLAGMRSIEY